MYPYRGFDDIARNPFVAPRHPHFPSPGNPARPIQPYAISEPDSDPGPGRRPYPRAPTPPGRAYGSDNGEGDSEQGAYGGHGRLRGGYGGYGGYGNPVGGFGPIGGYGRPIGGYRGPLGGLGGYGRPRSEYGGYEGRGLGGYGGNRGTGSYFVSRREYCNDCGEYHGGSYGGYY